MSLLSWPRRVFSVVRQSPCNLLETGQKEPSISVVVRLRKALECDVDYLLEGPVALLLQRYAAVRCWMSKRLFVGLELPESPADGGRTLIPA